MSQKQESPQKGTFTSRLKYKMTQSKTALYVGSSFAGIGRVLVEQGFQLSIPLTVSKLNGRLNLTTNMSYPQIISEIYRDKGIRGFYAGATPNLTRCLLRNVYKYPLMVGLPNFYRDTLPSLIKNYTSLLKVLTGGSIALVECMLTCPIERLKVYYMTSNEKMFLRKFIEDNQGRVLKEMFRGFTPLLMKQSMSWIVLLQTDFQVKQQIRKILALPQAEEIPTKYLLVTSVIVAAANTALVMPFDCVKTHMEKRDPTKTYIQTFSTIYRQAGMAGFFTGFRLRFCLYFTNALFVVNLLEKLELLSKKFVQ